MLWENTAGKKLWSKKNDAHWIKKSKKIWGFLSRLKIPSAQPSLAPAQSLTKKRSRTSFTFRQYKNITRWRTWILLPEKFLKVFTNEPQHGHPQHLSQPLNNRHTPPASQNSAATAPSRPSSGSLTGKGSSVEENHGPFVCWVTLWTPGRYRESSEVWFSDRFLEPGTH